MKKLVLVSGSSWTSEDQRFLDLAAWMGVSTKIVAFDQGRVSHERFLEELHTGPCCVAMSAETLVRLDRELAPETNLRRLMDELCTELLIFGCRESSAHVTALSRLTGGVVCGVRLVNTPDTSFTFPKEAKAYSQQFAGLSYLSQSTEPVPVFEIRDVATDSHVIVSVNDRPLFVAIERTAGTMFFLAGSVLLDIHEPLRRDHKESTFYDRLVPVLIFIRNSVSDGCWHGLEPTARVIIDDPLLAEQYGFLNYNELLKSMRRAKYGTSIAFIPWNYWRTSREDVSDLFDESSNLSICIHGCDHTNKEFEAQDLPLLRNKASLAITRMESHKARTGLTFDRVMVFPQGRFSTAAPSALRAQGYIGAVNSTCFPTDGELGGMTIGDSLRPAVMRYDGFPIFSRRYPKSLVDSAFDLFLGRPALLVEHHDYFRDGCRMLEDFVVELNRLEPSLSWPNLTSQLIRSGLRRRLSDGSIEIVFFTRKFLLRPCGSKTGRVVLRKHEPNAKAIERVLVNGISQPFLCENDELQLDVCLDDPHQILAVEIIDREKSPLQFRGFGVMHNAGVLLRRGLSEFRDNTLARHEGFLKIAKGVAKGLRVTGDS